MDNWNSLNESLTRFVNPATFPVAISFLRDETAIPSRARRPKWDLAVALAPCQGAAMARRYGWTIAFAREDVGWAIAAHSYGWEWVSRESQAEGAVAFLTRMNYASSAEAAKEALKGFRLLGAGEDLIVVYSPLEKTIKDPDVILIYGNPAQLMRLIHGTTYLTGKPIEGSFSGRAASCTEGVIGAYLDQSPKVVVPGNGDGVWGGMSGPWNGHGPPAKELAEVVKGLQKTHEKGIRYPIPTYLRYEPEEAFSISLSDIFKTEEQNKLKKKIEVNRLITEDWRGNYDGGHFWRPYNSLIQYIEALLTSIPLGIPPGWPA